MPKEVFGAGYSFLKDPQLMTLEEIGRIAESFVKLGVQKIRLTGGEPLLRQDIPELVSMLKINFWFQMSQLPQMVGF